MPHMVPWFRELCPKLFREPLSDLATLPKGPRAPAQSRLALGKRNSGYQ